MRVILVDCRLGTREIVSVYRRAISAWMHSETNVQNFT